MRHVGFCAGRKVVACRLTCHAEGIAAGRRGASLAGALKSAAELKVA